MSLTIELTAEETKRFEDAGIDLTSFLKGIAATLPPQPASSVQSGVEIDPQRAIASGMPIAITGKSAVFRDSLGTRSDNFVAPITELVAIAS